MKTLLFFIIILLAGFALFRTPITAWVNSEEAPVEEEVYINTEVRPDSINYNNQFSPRERDWLVSNGYENLISLNKDGQFKLVQAFISLNQKQDSSFIKTIDSIKLANPELRNVDLTALPELQPIK